MNGQTLKQSKFTATLCDVLGKQIRLNLCVVALIGLVLAGGGNARGDVVRNTISGFSYIGDGAMRPPLAFGILGLDGFPDNVVSLEPMRLEENVLQNNQVHLALIMGDDSTINNNIFEGTAPGVRPAGIWMTGRNVQVSGNVFRNMPEGMRIGGEDPDYGAILRVATNATLINNRFCNVDTNYNFQPLATYDLQSTLTCPEPSLDMVQAILLTWPFAYDGYSVESADSPDGPWTSLDATMFLHNGMHAVVVPSDGAPEFFRLVKP